MDAPNPPGIVIVGAGHCGGRAAAALRELGWTGTVHLVGDEPQGPYERPPLSKELLIGRRTVASCLMRPDAEWATLGITRHTRRATRIDTHGHRLELQDGTVLPYVRLLLATGGRARRLDIPGADVPQVRVLRTLDDALALTPRLVRGQRLLVIGGGFIGLEVAASARQQGVDVTVVEGAPRMLGRAMPAPVAHAVQDLHIAHGVELRLGVQPVRIETLADGAVRVLLSDGCARVADTVLTGIGMQPDTSLAQASGLAVGQGIVVNAALQTSAADVFAAGDVAEFPAPGSGSLQRQETWSNAEAQGLLAARNLLGARQPFTDAPWFWSDQYEYQLQACGESALGVQTVERQVGENGRILFHLDGHQRVVAMAAWGPAPGCLRDFKLARMLVERHSEAGAQALADVAQPLKSLLTRTGVTA